MQCGPLLLCPFVLHGSNPLIRPRVWLSIEEAFACSVAFCVLRNLRRTYSPRLEFFCTALTCSVKDKFISNTTPRYLNESFVSFWKQWDAESWYCTNWRNVPLKKDITGVSQNHSKEQAWLYHQKKPHKCGRCSTLRQSLVYKVYKNGLGTQPWGAAVLLVSTVDFMSPPWTHCGRLLKKHRLSYTRALSDCLPVFGGSVAWLSRIAFNTVSGGILYVVTITNIICFWMRSSPTRSVMRLELAVHQEEEWHQLVKRRSCSTGMLINLVVPSPWYPSTSLFILTRHWYTDHDSVFQTLLVIQVRCT